MTESDRGTAGTGRWKRRLAVVVLVISLLGMAGAVGISLWAVAVTSRVVVVDGDDRPVAGVALLRWDVLAPRVEIKTAWPLGEWLHPYVRPLGVALAWDRNGPVETGGSGTARVPDTHRLTAISAGELPVQPGQVYAVDVVGGDGAEPARIMIRPRPQLPASLLQCATLSFREKPLGEVVDWVAGVSGVRIDIDRRSLADEGIAFETPVTAELGDVPLIQSFRSVLSQLNLTVVQQSDSLIVLSQLDSHNQVQTRLYAVGDLLSSAGEQLEYDAAELEQLIEQVVWPNTWISVGGAGSLTISVPQCVMAVHQFEDVHLEIESLLALLRNNGKPPTSDAEAKLREALERRLTLKVNEVPLHEILQSIRDRIAFRGIQLDRPALEEEGVSLDSPMSLDVHDLPLDMVLRVLLERYNLTWIVQNDLLVITSKLQADNELYVRAYDVADLVASPAEMDLIIETFQRMVVPASWSCVGGAGGLVPWRSLLFVSQTAELHRQLDDLLLALRTDGRSMDRVEDRRLAEALRTVTSFEFRSEPLDSALQKLAARAAIANIVLERPALEEAGVDPRTPVTMHGRRISVAAALRHLLQSLQLGTQIRDGKLIVTSQLDLPYRTSLRVYPVADLVERLATPDRLVDLIEQSASPDAWERAGGTGSLTYFTPKQCLVVNASDAAFEAVEALFRSLRGRTEPENRVEISIRASLRSIYDWRFDGSVEQLAERLADGLDCTVLLDQPALETAGIRLTDSVQVDAPAQALEAALQRGLHAIGARFVVEGESIRITSGDCRP